MEDPGDRVNGPGAWPIWRIDMDQPIPVMRVPDTELAAPYTLGASINSYHYAFVLDFLTHDPTGAAQFASARRVLVDPSAIVDIIGGLQNALANYIEAYGDPNALAGDDLDGPT